MRDALLIIDMQAEMQGRIDSGRDHVNGDAPAVIQRIVASCRASGIPVVHVRHRSDDPASPFTAGAAGAEPMPCDKAIPGEAVFEKTGSSAFVGTGLEDHLRQHGITRLMVTGAVAGFCVTSTIRSASDLGFQVTIIRDGVLGFDLPDAHLSARQIFDVTMALLEADFATVIDSAEFLSDRAA